MWAESNIYWYRGNKVAKISNGTLYNKPEIILEFDSRDNAVLQEGTTLIPVDITGMLNKNIHILKVLKKISETRIINFYRKYKNKVDCFYVAFSGGKDSIVLLDLVSSALPEGTFLVLFGDTGMEFPDTYNLVDYIEKNCKEKNIPFYRASSDLPTETSWRLFGPPAKTLRWCCSVHKSAPQTLKLREITKNNHCTGFAMVGVREFESVTRSKYKIFNYGKKQKGQYALHPILDWSSAEIWLFIYYKQLAINLAYKKGNSRVGCLCCPMSAEGNRAWFRRINYPQGYGKYINIIKACLNNECDKDEYIKNNLWLHRYSGRDLNLPYLNIKEINDGDKYTITFNDNNHYWKEWRKTFPTMPFNYNIDKSNNILSIQIPSSFYSTQWSKIIRSGVLKSAYCVNCGTCAANCPSGAINFNNGKLTIENCLKCGICHSLDDACLHQRTTRQPKIESIKMINYNTLENYDINSSWFNDFFKYGNKFLESNSLGPKQNVVFKRFLRAANLLAKQGVTTFFDKIIAIGYESSLAWQLVLINSAQSVPQVRWYVKNLPLDMPMETTSIKNILLSIHVPDKSAYAIIRAFEKLCNLQFGTILHFGKVTTRGRNLETLCRTKPVAPDPRVFLYGLYKFAEGCNSYYEVSLGRLMDFSVEANGVSPSEIFGLSRDETEQYLHGLAQAYPDFVLSFSTTLGLELLNLNPDKTSEDVLTLF